MKASWLGGGLLAAALLALPMTARADDRWGRDDRYGNYDRSGWGRYSRNDTFARGYDRGFRDGSKEGRNDGQRGRRFELRREHDYWDADNGYKGWYGSRYDYAAGYRRGYEEGYRQSYTTYARGRYRDRDDDRAYRRW